MTSALYGPFIRQFRRDHVAGRSRRVGMKTRMATARPTDTKEPITNRWYVSCHLNSVPLCCRPTTSSPLTDRPTALLSSYLLLAAVIVALFGLASADSCRYYQGNISCCKRVLDRKRQGGLIFYRCRQCEDGHVLSDDKTQCVPDTSCASGTGPGLKNVAKKGECYSCSDDNCVRPG